MNEINAKYIGYLVCMTLLLSSIAIGCNVYWFQYPGNRYCVTLLFQSFPYIILLYIGCALQFGRHSKWLFYPKELFYFASIVSIIMYATYAVQYTPFTPIDDNIVRLDNALHINLPAMMHWAQHIPLVKNILTYTYESLSYQMTYLPLLLILQKRVKALHEFYFLLLTTTLIGFTFYYFFPTTAPASVLNSPYFSEAQRATNLKFQQLHHHIPPSTAEGGLIAMPSFHVIWAYLSLYMARSWPVVYWLLLPLNVVLVFSCVLLGWHYPLDIVGSMIVIILAHRALRYCYLQRLWTSSPFQDNVVSLI